MGSTFSTGTINQPDAGSVGLAMIEKIRDDIVAHPAWDLVEEYQVPTTGLGRWYVFKCDFVQSGLPNDFFVIMWRTLGSGEIRMCICEGYNSVTHVATHFGHPAYNTSNIVFERIVPGRAFSTGSVPPAI